MSFATDLASLKAAINSFGDLIKNKFLTMIPASEKGATNGVAPLVNGLVPAQYLPSFVDDVLEFNGVANFPATGETGKVYIDTSSVDLPAYRWSGSGYFQINNHVGNADVATKLATARTISASGDASWSVTFDGSGNATAVMTLATVPIAKGGTGAVTATNARANLGLAIGTDVQAQNADLQSIANIVATSGLLKKTAAGTWSLDTNTYSISTHNHDSAYAPIAHVGVGGTAHAAVTTTVNGFMLAADKVKVDALSGTNTGDETAATIKTKLGISTLSGSNTGDQSISISGDVTASGSFGVLVATVTKLNGVALSALATGLLKNTTTSGIPSIAVAGTDYVAPGGALGTPSSGNLANCTFPTLNQNTTGNAATATTATNAAQLTGVQQLNPLLGSQSSMAMSQDGGATKGSFIARSAGTGDANLAGMTFWNDAYAIKMGVRADGYFGLGGWSRAAWSWYSDPSGNMVAAGNVSAYSDPRLKDNIVVIENALDVCNALDGVFFTWNNRSKLVASPGKRDVGLLANQVKAILPMLVTPSITDDETGEVYDTVDYAKMVPVLLQAIKDLHMKVRQLEGN